MSTPSSDPVIEIPQSLSEAYEELRIRLVSEPYDGRPLSRIKVAVDSVRPLEWLSGQSTDFKCYWHSRNASGVFAGAGIARKFDDSDAFHGAMALLEKIGDIEDVPRFYGGYAFDGAPNSPEWESFGSGWFVLPRFEFQTGDSGSFLILNVLREDDTEQVLAEINRLEPPNVFPTWIPPGFSEESTTPEFPQWESGIAQALEEFESGNLDKVVLARLRTFDFPDAVDAMRLLSELQDRTPACTHFLFQMEADTVFIGATPERLFRRDSNWLYTEAIAGTRRRGETDMEDSRLSDQLLADPKERYEHEVVKDYIVDALGALAMGIEAGKTDVLKLVSKRHLYTPIAAILQPEVTALDLLRALHPTPAVAGISTRNALKHIAKAESFDRGWYAGPIGWIAADSAEFFVAIRSGLLQTHRNGSRLNLYSGAGIVPGSNPQAEWEEVETKLSDFLRVISPSL